MWRHSSIADSRPGRLSSSAPEPWPVRRIFPLWWNGLPFAAVIAGSLRPTLAIAGHTLHVDQRRLDAPSAADITPEDIK